MSEDELGEIDLLGYSIGGYIAQELTLIRPQRVRRIVLAGTAREGGVDNCDGRDGTRRRPPPCSSPPGRE